MESSLLFALLSKRYMDPGSGSKCGFFTEFGSALKFKLDLDPHISNAHRKRMDVFLKFDCTNIYFIDILSYL